MYYRATVEGPLKDLHSGVYGGMVYEPLAVLTKLLASLTSSDGTILVPGVNELVEPLTPTELFVTSFFVNYSHFSIEHYPLYVGSATNILTLNPKIYRCSRTKRQETFS
jgi:hypothetical protein